MMDNFALVSSSILITLTFTVLTFRLSYLKKLKLSLSIVKGILVQLLIAMLIVPFLLQYVRFSGMFVLTYLVLSISGYFAYKSSLQKTTTSEMYQEELHLFLMAVILKLQQGINFVQALSESNVELKSDLNHEISILIDGLVARDSSAIEDFQLKNDDFIIKSFCFLLNVTIENSTTVLELMYQEFMNDLRVLNQQTITLKQRIQGYRIGLRIITIVIILTSTTIVSTLNVGVFNQMSQSPRFQFVMLFFFVFLFLTHLIIEMLMNKTIRRKL